MIRHDPLAPGLDFFTGFVISGTLRGADATCTPDEVTALFGDDFVESGRKGQLLRCYALAEFAWQRDSPAAAWDGVHVTVQAHRLRVPLLIGDLAAALDGLGFPLVEVAPDGAGCRRFVRADSRVGLLVGEEDGAVLKVTTPTWFLPGPRGEREPGWSREAGRNRIGHLVGLGQEEREQWAARRRPDAAGVRARWWWFLWTVCRPRTPVRTDEDRARWAELGLWLLGECEAAGVVDRAEAAVLMSASGLLPPDRSVRMCLDAIAVSRTRVATRDTTAYTRENIAAVNLSRQAKRLSLAVREQLPLVRDPVLRAEAEAWLELRTRLM